MKIQHLQHIWDTLNRSVELEVKFNNSFRFELGPLASTSFGIQTGKYHRPDLPPELYLPMGGKSSAEFLESNYQLITGRLKSYYGELGDTELQIQKAYARALYALPLFHASTAHPQDIIERGGLLSHKLITRLESLTPSNSNTTPGDVNSGRDAFTYFSLGRVYLGGNNHPQATPSLFVIDQGGLTNPRFVVQSHGLLKIDNLFSENEKRYNARYDNLNRTTLTASDFVEVASFLMAKGIPPSTFMGDEAMIRNSLPSSEISYVLRSIDDNEEKGPFNLIEDHPQSTDKTLEQYWINIQQLCFLQTPVKPDPNFLDKTHWGKIADQKYRNRPT